ncbi:hypothetical protein [Frigidibacter sp. ROC022]|uniref:hypothetical protein n=1 Tax=Frigidibacter sp. ROC022 TaxID=2971796 RepID=UPI00215B2707|nr:hypothetical protein [Frigidibacter sp. ROC022]MCR8725993.1 hypothetical protein [Frigidibacter sp. ROC022]
MPKLLILGSGPNVTDCRHWPRAPFDRIVAINNAWRVRPDWDDLVAPEDFPAERHPPSLSPGQRLIEADAFVPAQNAYGGFVYAGGTMAFTAAYWALHALRPRLIAFLGCDMVYPTSGATHFYGTGTADPLRDDITLRSLEAKSARLMILAARQGCRTVNLSQEKESRLILPRARREALDGPVQKFDAQLVNRALRREAELGYMVPSGRYWDEAEWFSIDEIDALDALWLAAARG